MIFFFSIKSESSDSFVNHFDGHFAYIKTLNFYFKTVSPSWGDPVRHTPSTAFRHLPPNSARFSYATEGALFISAQLCSDAVNALRKVRVLIWL